MPYTLPTPLLNPDPRLNATDMLESQFSSTASAAPDVGPSMAMPQPQMPVLNQLPSSQYQSPTPSIDQQAPGTLRQQLLDDRGQYSWFDDIADTPMPYHEEISGALGDAGRMLAEQTFGQYLRGQGAVQDFIGFDKGGDFSRGAADALGDAGEFVGGALYPETVGQASLELLPGVGTVPGASSFIREAGELGIKSAIKSVFGVSGKLYNALPDFPVEIQRTFQGPDGLTRMGIVSQDDYDDEVLRMIGAKPDLSAAGGPLGYETKLSRLEQMPLGTTTKMGNTTITREAEGWRVMEGTDSDFFENPADAARYTVKGAWSPNGAPPEWGQLNAQAEDFMQAMADKYDVDIYEIYKAPRYAYSGPNDSPLNDAEVKKLQKLYAERDTYDPSSPEFEIAQRSKETIRKATSGEDLGSAVDAAQYATKTDQGVDIKASLEMARYTPTYIEVNNRPFEISKANGQFKVDSMWFPKVEDAIEYIQRKAGSTGVFTDINRTVTQKWAGLKSYSNEQLQEEIEELTAQLYQMDDHEAIMRQWNTIRQYQAILDQRIGKSSLLSDALKNVFGPQQQLLPEAAKNLTLALRAIAALSSLDVDHLIGLDNLIDLANVIGFDAALGVLKGFTPTGGYSHLSTPLANIRDIQHVMAEIVTAENSGIIKGTLQKAIAATGINPSLAISTPEGRMITAFQRLLIEAEGLTDATVKANWDSVSTNAVGRDIFQLDVNNHMKTGGVKLPWQKVFEDPNSYVLNQQQRAAIDRFNQVIDDIETLRENNGLKSRRKDLGGRIYVPRQVRTINGVKVPRFSDANLGREYDEILDSVAAGNIYGDPRSALELHLKAAYREMANAQMTDQMSRYGVKPNELVPEPIRIEREKTAKALTKARREARLEGQKAQTIFRNLIGKDFNEAQREYEAARRGLVRIKGELAGRGQLHTGKIQTPTSYGPRLRDANARLTAAKAARDAAADMKNKTPGQRGKAGAQRLISPTTQANVDTATHAHNKAKVAYADAIAKINTDAKGGVRPEAYFSPPMVIARGDLLDAEKNRRAAAAAYKQANPSKPGAYRQDPDWQLANADYKAAKANYDSTLRQAKIDYPDDISVAAWRNKFFPEKNVKEIEDGLAQYFNDPDGASKFIQTVVNLRRTTATALDFAAPFIHGLPVLGRNPGAWARGTFDHYRAFLNPKVQASFARAHINSLNEMAQYELIPGSSDFYAATEKGGGIGLDKLEQPFGIGKKDTSIIGIGDKGKGVRRTAAQVGRQTFGRFASAYETGLLEWRTLMWEGMKSHWKGTPAELAQHIRNLTGGIDTRALGVHPSQRAWEGMWMALSPKLLRSTVALAADLRYGPFDSRGFAALRALTSMAGVVTFGYYLIGKALGRDDDEILNGLNPLNGKRFLSYKINGQWYGIGGTARALFQAAAGTWAAAAPKFSTNLPVVGDLGAGTERPIHDLISSNSQENPLLNLFATRGAPGTAIATTIGEGLTGANLTGFEQVDGMPDILTELGRDSLPFVIGGAIEGDSALGSVTSLMGLRTSPETPVEERAEEIELNIIPELVNQGIIPASVQSIDDLGFGEADAVGRYLKETRPELVESYEAWRRRFGSVYQQKQDERKQVEAAFKPAFDKLYQDLLSGEKSGGAVRTELASLRDELRGSINQLYADPEFQKQVAGIEHNEMEKLADAYYEIVNDYRTRNGIPEKSKLSPEGWEEIEKLQDDFVDALNPGMRERFVKDQDLRDSVFDAHPIIRLKREVDEASETYYEQPEKTREEYLEKNPTLNVQRWVMYDTALQSTEAVDAVLRKQAVGLAGEVLPRVNKPVKLAGYPHRIDTDQSSWTRDKPFIVKYESMPDALREASRDIPPINAMLMYWGATETVNDPQALPIFDNYMQQTWPEWSAYRNAVNLYLLLPGQDREFERDKPHALAASPQFDAQVNIWLEHHYGKTPEFKTQAARTEYFRLTGRDASKFPIIPLKE